MGRELDVQWRGRHRRQRNGPRGRSDAARRRLERDGMYRHQVNDMFSKIKQEHRRRASCDVTWKKRPAPGAGRSLVGQREGGYPQVVR